MRNLKKILALVLALVMSLSLMATASAAETAPADSANAYATAEKVLEGLGVFKGDLESGSMAYERNVKRSEASALLYRIMTGDVKEEQAKLYSNKNFTDGVTGHWAEGPIAYCYNAEIIKGVNDYDFYLMRQIFYTADRLTYDYTTSTDPVYAYYIDGEVYTGTQSLTDKSDVMTWAAFVAEYLTAKEVKVTSVTNGNELKIIDNNNDGKAEYVLRTNYTLDKITRSATANDTTVYYYQGLNTSVYKPVYLDGYTPTQA